MNKKNEKELKRKVAAEINKLLSDNDFCLIEFVYDEYHWNGGKNEVFEVDMTKLCKFGCLDNPICTWIK